MSPTAVLEEAFRHFRLMMLIPQLIASPTNAAFTPAAMQKYDAHVAMYHDQGHIPFKMLSFEDGVNWTLGVPIIRTSVDHGTAFDIVGKGVASPKSLLSAAHLATKLVLTAKTP